MADEEPEVQGDDEESSGGGWIVTFADMMSLLLAFFVLLLSFSNTDAEKFKQVAKSMREAFSFHSAPIPGATRERSTSSSPSITALQRPVITMSDGSTFQARLEAAKREIDEYIETAGLAKHVHTEIASNSLKIVNSNPLNFPLGKAAMLASSTRYLDAMLPILKRFEFEIVVEGHTDDLPIRNFEYQSNWELSSARAASFVYYLEDNGIDPSRLAVHGFGPYRPVAPNDSETNRARNRRIEILFNAPASHPATTALSDLSDEAREMLRKNRLR